MGSTVCIVGYFEDLLELEVAYMSLSATVASQIAKDLVNTVMVST